MINLCLFLILALILPYTVLILSYGIRLGKAMQQAIPPVPLAVPANIIAKSIAKVGKRTVRLVKDFSELKVVKKKHADKEETSIFDS